MSPMAESKIKSEQMQGNKRACKLDEEKVRAIRKDTRRTSVVAADHGVSESLISNIRARRAWTHVKD